jgi:uncharacterized protein involved in outer membrane biogenesis
MDTRKMFITKMSIALAASLLLMILTITTADAMQQNSDEPYRVEEFSINTPGDLEVRTSGGHITVEGSGDDQVRVEMYVSKNGRSLSPSDTDLDEFEITIARNGNRVQAIAKKENSDSWKFWKNNNTSISFVVYTPKEMSTDLRTSGGHIKTTDLRGTQQIRTSGGHLQLANLEGTVDARTSGGHIEISDVSGEIEARTSGGHIDAENTEGNLRVRTSGGHIDLENIAGTVEASTSGGGISADITEMGEFARLRTSGGNVHITVPRNIGLDLDLRGSRVRTQLENFSGSMEDDDVEGSINGGGPMLSARTSGGTVRVSFK